MERLGWLKMVNNTINYENCIYRIALNRKNNYPRSYERRKDTRAGEKAHMRNWKSYRYETSWSIKFSKYSPMQANRARNHTRFIHIWSINIWYTRIFKMTRLLWFSPWDMQKLLRKISIWSNIIFSNRIWNKWWWGPSYRYRISKIYWFQHFRAFRWILSEIWDNIMKNRPKNS